VRRLRRREGGGVSSGETAPAPATDVAAAPTSPDAKRPDGMPVGRPFAPGQSGNPKGRPPGVAAAARRLIGEDGSRALEFLADLMDGKPLTIETVDRVTGEKRIEAELPPVKERRLAAEALLDRACGKVAQPLEHTGADGAPLDARLEVVFVRPAPPAPEKPADEPAPR
jgi:Family of unknown function (DUF5681)